MRQIRALEFKQSSIVEMLLVVTAKTIEIGWKLETIAMYSEYSSAPHSVVLTGGECVVLDLAIVLTLQR